MTKIGENLTISTAVALLNEGQESRLMRKHGWNSESFGVRIVGGSLQAVSAHEEPRPHEFLEGDFSSLWDVYEL